LESTGIFSALVLLLVLALLVSTVSTGAALTSVAGLDVEEGE
jgi:hypothetical protein